MQTSALLMSKTERPAGTGGFLNPASIALEFGVQQGMSIADFGSGAGYFTTILAAMVGHEGRVYALDIQETALDNVRARARAEGLNNIETIRTNLEILGSSSLSDSSQDMVLLANILFESHNDPAILREAVRVLKSGSRIIIIDWKKGSGGFGPPNDLRLSVENMKKLAQDDGLIFEKDFDAGQFHFGLAFKKS